MLCKVLPLLMELSKKSIQQRHWQQAWLIVAAGRKIELGLVEGKTCRTPPPGLMGTAMAYSPFISITSDRAKERDRNFLHLFMQLIENRLYFCWFWVIFQPARAYWGHQRLAMFAAMFKQKPRSKSGWWFGTMEFCDFPFSWEFHHPN